MTNVIGLIFDGGLAILLIVTIGYCSRLSRRIRVLQDSRSELAGMITQFDQATARAMTSLAELQTVSKRITEALQLKIEKANFLADDLAFLIEKSAKLATQLEQTRSAIKPKPAPEIAAEPPAPPTPAKPKVAAYHPPQAQGNDIPSSIKSASSLEALLNRLSLPTGTIAPTQPKPYSASFEQPQGPRTNAERELLEALKSDR